MMTQTNVFHHATMPADTLRLALTINADATAYHWQTAFPVLAALDKMSMRRSATILPNDCPNNALDAYILARLGMPIDTGLAMLQAATLKIPQALEDVQHRNIQTWFKLSPVHWRAGRDKVHLLSFKPSDISIEESKQLLDSIAPWLIELDWRIHVTATQQWFVRSSHGFDYAAPDLDVAVSDQLEHFLPQGRDLKRWQTILTEIQMTWFNHPVNQKREAQRQLPINSVWLDNASSAAKWSESLVADWAARAKQIHTFSSNQTHKHLEELNSAFEPVLQSIQDNGNCQITLLGDMWQQDVTISKPSMGERLKGVFTSKKAQPLSWLQNPNFEFLEH